MVKFNRTLILVVLIAGFVQTSNAFFWSTDVENSSKKIDELQKRKNDIDNMLKSCSYIQVPNSEAIPNCLLKNGIRRNFTNDQLRRFSDASAQIEKDIAAIKAKGKEQLLKEKADTPEKKEAFKKYTEDVDGLIKKKNEFDRDLAATGIQAGLMFARLDNTVLGEYTNYVVTEYSKSPEMKQNICKTVSSCDAVKKFQADTKGSLLSLEKWREARDGERKYEKPATDGAAQK